MTDMNATNQNPLYRPAASGTAPTLTPADVTTAPQGSSAAGGAIDGRDPTYINKFALSASTPSGVPGIDQASYAQGQKVATDAGLPLQTPQQLTQAQQAAAGDPRMDQMTQLMQGAIKDPKLTAGNTKSAYKLAEDMSGGKGGNIWGLVVVALMQAAREGQKDQEYQINVLRDLNNMQNQMMDYSKRLTQVQHDLDAAVGDGKKANTNAQVAFNDEKEFPTFQLDKDGKLVSKDATDKAPVSAGSLKKKSKDDDVNKDGKWTNVEFEDPHDTKKTIKGSGGSLDEARQNAADTYNQGQQSHSGKDSMISSSGLTQHLQQFTQRLDQLNGKITQKQNAIQNSMQTEQQNYAQITSVMKGINDMQSNTTRNLL